MTRRAYFFVLLPIALALSSAAQAPTPQSHTADSSTAHHSQKNSPTANVAFDPGSVKSGIYRETTFAFTCKIPEAWVLRTEEMNARDDDGPQANSKPESNLQRVLLAAFARPPQARGEDINSSILIAAESISAYPGLKDAAQYFGPVAEITKSQGLAMNDEPYEYEIGAKTVVRADFQKDVGTRVLRQSTLVILAKGYALSFTFIGGTEHEVEELIDGLSFTAAPKPQSH
jgi:hypothetical protein